MATRLPPPKGFGTRPELWEDFAFKLKSYLNLQEHDYGEVMDRSSTDLDPITDDLMTWKPDEILKNEKIPRKMMQSPKNERKSLES